MEDIDQKPQIFYIYSYFNLRCRIKASSLQDKTEGEYGMLMNNYQLNYQCLIHTAKISDGEPFG